MNLLVFLSGCYCFDVSRGESSVRNLTGPEHFSLCDAWGGEGCSVQLNTYYGFPSSDEVKFEAYFDKNNITEYRINSPGQIGMRIEKYIPPIFLPNAILGIGLDYSQKSTDLSYEHYDYGFRSINDLNFIHRRAMLSANLMTWVEKRSIGYITFQGGLNFVQKNYPSELEFFHDIDLYNITNFEYRIGYGFQFYSKKLLGIALEGGYGGGAYLKVGLCYWLF